MRRNRRVTAGPLFGLATRNRNRSFAVVAAIALGLLMAVPALPAEREDLNNMGARWWQWALSIPGNVNPTLGSYGSSTNPLPDQCMIGQSGPVWFLAGYLFGGTATRTCAVPEGKSLFFPLANSINFNTPECGQNLQSFSASKVRMLAAAGLAGDTYSATLDGSAIHNVQLLQSPVFEVTLPGADNAFNVLFGTPCAPNQGDPSPTLQAGVYSPSADIGYYVLLDPLKKGVHVLHMQANGPTFVSPIDVTYTLNVVAVSEN